MSGESKDRNQKSSPKAEDDESGSNSREREIDREIDREEGDIEIDMGPETQFIGKQQLSSLSPELSRKIQKNQRFIALSSQTSQEHGQEEPNTQLEAVEPLHQSVPLQISHFESEPSSSDNQSQNRFQKLILVDQVRDSNQRANISAENSLEYTIFRDRIGSSSTVDTPYDESLYSEPVARNRLDYAKNQNAQQIKNSWSRIRMIYDNQNTSQDTGTSSEYEYPVDKSVGEGYDEINFMKHQAKNSRKASSCTTAVPSRAHSIVASNTTMIPTVCTTTLPHVTDLSDEAPTGSTSSSDLSPKHH